MADLVLDPVSPRVECLEAAIIPGTDCHADVRLEIIENVFPTLHG